MRELNKKVLGIAVFLLALAMLAVPISAVYATKPIPVSGTFMLLVGGTITPRDAGKSTNRIQTITDVPTLFAGDISGTGYYDSRWVIHNSDDPAASWRMNVKSTYTITATVDGKSGILHFETSGFTLSKHPNGWRITGGTGDLAGLQGQGTFTDNPATPNPFDYIYSGQVHFDP